MQPPRFNGRLTNFNKNPLHALYVNSEIRKYRMWFNLIEHSFQLTKRVYRQIAKSLIFFFRKKQDKSRQDINNCRRKNCNYIQILEDMSFIEFYGELLVV